MSGSGWSAAFESGFALFGKGIGVGRAVRKPENGAIPRAPIQIQAGRAGTWSQPGLIAEVQPNPCADKSAGSAGISGAHGKGTTCGSLLIVSRETTGPKALSLLTRAGMNNQIRNPENAATPNARLNFCRQATGLSRACFSFKNEDRARLTLFSARHV